MLGVMTPANAVQTSGQFLARVSIETSCAISVSDLDFGNVGVIAAQTASAAVTVNCSQGTPYSLSFSGSASVTSYNGTMLNGPASVAYSAALTSAGGAGSTTVPIIAVLLPQSTPPGGIYTDSRTVYLNY